MTSGSPPHGTSLTEVGASRNRSYEPALDYFRALAAITVVVYHVTVTYRGYNDPPPDWIHTSWPRLWNPALAYIVEGHTAVTLFMVLSGYVLTKGVIGRRVSYGGFIANRLLRIAPLYVFVTIYGISIHPEAFNVAGLVQTVLPFANIPGSLQSEVLTALFWSVAVEFQFYFLFPFLKTFIERIGLAYGVYAIALFTLFRCIALAFKVDMQHFIYTTIFGRADQFLIGMMLAFLPRYRWQAHRYTLPFAVVLVLSCLTVFNRLGGYPVYAWWKLFWPSIEALMWAFTIAAGLNAPYRMPRIARTGLVAVANMSFSIYIVHSTVLQIFGERRIYVHVIDDVYLNALANSTLLLVPVLLLSWVTYSVVEKPFMDLRGRYVG